jgi:hypothetical protein
MSEAKTAARPLETVGNLPAEVERVVANGPVATTPGLDQTEVIRSAMSGLGKRSATARAQKKAQSKAGETD